MTRRPLAFAILAALAAPLALAVPALADDDCRYSDSIQEVLDAGGVERLRIDAAAGSLRVTGRDGLGEVVVDGTRCASDGSDLEEIRLRTERRGAELLVRVDIPDLDWGWRDYMRLDLDIQAPSTLAVEIEDGSGWIEVFDVAAASIEDGSGEILVERVHGALRIDDGSGEIEIDGVGGDLRLEDGSGEIEIRNVEGSVVVEEDGSGGMRIEGVRRDVEIDEDGSGSIAIRDVGGSVRIREDGSGSIRAVDVVGDLIVDRDGSGGISTDRIGGRIELPD